MNERESIHPLISRLQAAGIVAAAAGVVGLAIAFVSNRDRFLEAYLFGFLFWFGLTMGCFVMILIHHMIRGRWGLPALRIWEAGTRNLILMFVFFLPILGAVLSGKIYPWAMPHSAIHSEKTLKILEHQAPYLNLPFFLVRIALFFVLWIGISSILNRSSIRQDETGDLRLQEGRASLAAPGIVLLVITLTLAYTDWVMSLDPRWFSTIYGVWWVVGMGLGATALAALLTTSWKDRKPFSDVVSEGFTRDIGNVLLTFTMFWGYISLSQWLIQYSGNLPEEISYYSRRGLSPDHRFVPYWILSVVIVLGQFFVPFVALLSGRTKRTPRLLMLVAVEILIVRVLDVFWNIIPFFHSGTGYVPPEIVWMSAAAWLAIGGVWLAAFGFWLKKHALVPRHVPRGAVEALEHA